MTLNEKAAYLKGIADGMKLSDADPNGKLLLSIIDLLDDMAKTVSDNEDAITLLGDDVDDLYEALGEDEDFDDEDDDEEDDEEDGDLYEVECPKCGEKIYLDYDEIQEGDITCPACGEALEIEITDESDDDDEGDED